MRLDCSRSCSSSRPKVSGFSHCHGNTKGWTSIQWEIVGFVRAEDREYRRRTLWGIEYQSAHSPRGNPQPVRFSLSLHTLSFLPFREKQATKKIILFSHRKLLFIDVETFSYSKIIFTGKSIRKKHLVFHNERKTITEVWTTTRPFSFCFFFFLLAIFQIVLPSGHYTEVALKENVPETAPKNVVPRKVIEVNIIDPNL